MIFAFVFSIIVFTIIVFGVFYAIGKAERKNAQRTTWTDADLAAKVKQATSKPPSGFFFKVESSLAEKCFVNNADKKVVMIHACCGKSSGSKENHNHNVRMMIVSLCETSGDVIESKKIQLDEFTVNGNRLEFNQLPFNKVVEQVDVVIKQLATQAAGVATGPEWTGEFYGTNN